MGFTDPFYGYSFLLRAILYVATPAFGVWQLLRLRRALHVFQLEGYKPGRFLAWCRAHPRRALFLTAAPAKKPLVMTGRAWRILVLATALSLSTILLVAGVVHVFAGGWPLDIPAWGLTTVAVFGGTPWILVLADRLLAPVQKAVNARYLRAARRKLDDVKPCVIGVTGSFGKTSTKFAIERLVGPPGAVLATPGSFNTPLGVCRTVNERLTSAHRFFVVEMGAYGEGEIAELCRFVRPSIGVLTAVGPAHLERFGSMDAIRRAKYEIVAGLPEDGVAIMNVDDLEVRELADRHSGARSIRYGIEEAGRPRITAHRIRASTKGTSLTIVDLETGKSVDGTIPLLGRHAVGHVLAGTAVAIAVGRPLREIASSLSRLSPVEHRLQLIEGGGGVTIIDDAYNSNPDGAAAALEVLESLPATQKVVVTPGIIELGPLQFQENERFGERAAKVADKVIVVAKVNRAAIVSGAERAGAGDKVVTVDSLADARALLATLLEPRSVVLFENDLPDQYEGR